MWSLIICLCIFGVCYGTVPTLQVGRKYNHLGRDVLDSMPKTIQEAAQLGFDQVGNCTDNPKFNGIPYRRKNDFAYVVLFDLTGEVAGFQITIFNSSLIFGEILRKPFILNGDHYALTVYFKDPSLICTPEAPLSGAGSYALFLQMDESPSSSIEISLDEKSLDLEKWKKGDCVKFFGRHYWLKTEEPSSCEVDTPFFIVFDAQGQLFSFGHGLLYSKQFQTTGINPILNKLFIQAASPCLKTPALLDTLYTFLSVKWVRPRCFL